jgi:putative phosphoribosyl transferase
MARNDRRSRVVFVDRHDAGKQLAPLLAHLRSRDPLVLGLPRGGVPVAAVVAHELDAQLDVIVVRKLGAPSHSEYAIGAIGEDGVVVLDEDSMRLLGLDQVKIAVVERAEREELVRQVVLFRRGRPPLGLGGRTAIIVDDGVATGATATAACRVVRALGAETVVLAVPIAPRGWKRSLIGEADELIAVETPDQFGAVGAWYSDFRQTTDDEVLAALSASTAS